ncbi:cytochrome p450 [Rhyzopertha dominica]|nr:cytochrome p450 [Rhyzopertha dominica]
MVFLHRPVSCKKWKKHRRMITPTFHFNILEDFIPVFNSCGNKLVSKLKAEVGKDSFDLYSYIPSCTLDIICETAMGVFVNAQDNPNSDYVKATGVLCCLVLDRMFSVVKAFDWSYWFTPSYKSEIRALRTLKTFVKDVIRKRKAELEDSGSVQNEIDEFGLKKKRAFLDMLLLSRDENGQPMTDQEIEDEVHTFMFEGHDTTATSLCFTLYLLAGHADIQEKAYEELNGIFGDDDRDCTHQDLQNMQYLELVIKESLRLYPSVPSFAREVVEDVDYYGRMIPKGTTVHIFAYAIHRDPSIYPEPEKFDPERFRNIKDKSPYAYIPFSAGPRNCIGQKFAMLELKSTLCKLLRRYKFRPAVPEHKLVLSPDTILRSRSGVRVKIEERNI